MLEQYTQKQKMIALAAIVIGGYFIYRQMKKSGAPIATPVV